MAKDPKLVHLVTDPPLGPTEGPFSYEALVEAARNGLVPTPPPNSVFAMGPAGDVVVVNRGAIVEGMPRLTNLGFEKMILARMAAALGLTYEQLTRELPPPMAEITPKMRRLLHSGDRRKRKRGMRLYWAAPGGHSLTRPRWEIDQGNFERSKILIREGFARMADSARQFSSGILKAQEAVERMKVQFNGIRAGKTAFLETEMERMREADPNVKIVVIKPREEK